MSSNKFIARNGLAVGTTPVDIVDANGTILVNSPTAAKLQTARTISLSGDVAGSVSFDGSGNVDISTTVQPDSIALGTDTTGNYMVNVAAGTGVSVSHTQGEGSTATISIGQAVGTTDNVTFNNVTVNGTLTSDDITSTNISVAGNATITGNLTVSGTTTTVNSTTVAIADLNLELAKNATTAAQANGAGITIDGPATPATFTYTSADDRWNLNKNLNVTTVYGALSGNASTASAWQTARTETLSGDVTGSASVDGSANWTINTTLANSGVTAGTYTKVTVDAKGRVTTGTTLSASDIPSLSATYLPLTGGTLTGTLYLGASSGATRSIINTNGDFYSYYSTETNYRIGLGRDIGVSGGAGLALGGSTYAMVGTGDTVGTTLYFKTSSTTATITTSPGAYLTGTNFYATGSLRAPIFYDSDDTAYYLDANTGGTSLNVAGNIILGNGGSDTGLRINHGNGSGDYGRIRFYQAGSNNQTIHVFPTTWQGGTLAGHSAGAINLTGANGVTFGNWNDVAMWVSTAGDGQAKSSLRAPIFYDSNDTNYYVDPNSTSYIYDLNTRFINFRSHFDNYGPGYWYRDDTSTVIQTFNTSASNSAQLNIRHSYSDAIIDSQRGWLYLYGSAVQTNNSLRSPIFYDSNDTGYYTDPASTSNMNTVTATNFRMGNALYLGGNNYYINNNSTWFGTNTSFRSDTDIRATIFYDNNDTAYYLDPASASTAAVLNGNVRITPRSASWAEGIQFYMPTSSTWGGLRWVRNNSNFYGSWYIGWTALDSSDDIVFGANVSGTQVDNVLRLYSSTSGSARIGRDLYIYGLTGGNYGNRLVVGNTSTSYTLQDGNVRPTIQVHGQYPVVSLNHTVTSNSSHGPTIQFTANGTGRQFVIGMNGTGTQLDIGVSNSTQTDWNPHNGIADYLGTTGFRMDTSGNVYNYVSNRSPIFYDSNDTAYYIDPNNGGFNLKGGTSNRVTYSTNDSGFKVYNAEGNGVGDVRLGAAWGYPGVYSSSYLMLGSENYIEFRTQNSQRGYIDNSANLFAYGSMRSPIFYDYNNTGYYTDPADTSYLNYLTLGGRNMRSFEHNSFVEFYVEGDANTYYPVRFDVSAWMHWGRWSISRGYGDTAPWDPIGTGSHHGGLTLTWEWSGDGAWGGNDHNVRVVEWTEQYTTMVGGMALSVNGMIVWLRGGHAYYRFHGPGGMTNGATPYYSTYTASNGATFSPRSNASSAAGEINYRYPVRGSGNLYDWDHWVLHENEWQNDKYFGSDGLIYSNQSRPYIMYDRSDTAYYLDPNSTGTSLNIAGGISTPLMWVNYSSSNYNNFNEGIRLYSANNGAAVITFNTGGTTGSSYSSLIGYTDRLEKRWAGQWQERMYNGYSEAYGSYRAPIFYDSNDTGYYCDPNGNSQFWGLRIRGDAGSTSNDNQITFWGSGTASTTSAIGFKSNGAPFSNPTGNGDGYNTYFTMDTDGRGWVFRRGTGGTDFTSAYNSGWILNNGLWQANSSMRAPIFYDSDDTGYFCNPNGTTTLNNLYVVGGVAGVSNSSSYTEAAIEIRERTFGGAQDDTWATAPRLSFHWGGRVASQIGMGSNGWINILNNPGSGWESFRAGDIYATGNVTAYYSDERLKTKVGKIENAVATVKAIETFKYTNNQIAKDNGFKGDEIQIGVSAQSVEKVLPEIVKHAPFDIETQDGEIISKTGEWYKTVQYDRLVPVLIEAIKEQQSEIDELKALVKQLLAK